MDFHKLQETLNSIEPSDRARDIEMLKRAASGNNSPSPREEIAESATVDRPKLTNEAAQMAALAGINTTSASPRVNSEAAQMAALAGITLNEGQKTGRAGQVKGSEAVKSSSKSSGRGEQEHPFDGRLVGSAEVPRENKDDDIDEAGALDAFNQGRKEYNNTKAFKGAKSSKDKGGKDTAKANNVATEQSLPPKLAQALGKYSTALSNITRKPELKRQFQELMKAADPSLQLESYMEGRKKYVESQNKTPVAESTTATSNNKDSIKAELLRRLNQHK